MEQWLENLKDTLEGLVNQVFDILFVLLLGAFGVTLILLVISAIRAMHTMHEKGHSWQDAFQYAGKTWLYALAVGIVAAVPAAVLATRGVFGQGIQTTIQSIFGV